MYNDRFSNRKATNTETKTTAGDDKLLGLIAVTISKARKIVAAKCEGTFLNQ